MEPKERFQNQVTTRREQLTMGYFANFPSYTRKTTSPATPIMSGARIWAEFQGCCTPPIAKAIVIAQADPTTITFPLVG